MATSPRRAGSPVGAYGAASLLLLLLHVVPMCCSPTTTTAESPLTRKEHLPPLYEPGTPGGVSFRTGDTHPSFGKVDIFVDLTCPKSAAAWPTLQHMVKDQRDRLSFAFHILPLSKYPIAHFAAKAVQVILANSHGTFDDIERFADLMFRNQRMILYEEEYDMTLDAREIVSDWAIAASTLTAETFHRGMREPLFDDIIADLDGPFLHAVSDTPAVLLNGIFIIHLRGEQELRDLQAFIADPSFGSDDDDDALDGSAYADDDDDMSLMWKLTELEIRGDYEDLQRRTRRAQQLRAIKEKFEQMQQEQQEQQQQQQREQQQQQLDEQTQQHLEQQALLQQHTTRLRGAGVNALSSSTGYGLGTLRPQESGYGSDSADPCFSSWEDPPDLSYSSSSRSWSLTTFSSFVRDFFSSTTGDEEGEGEQGDGGGSAEAGKPAAVRGPAAAWIAKRQHQKRQEQHQEQREAAAAATTGEANRGQQQLPRGVATVWSRWSFFGSLFGSFEEFGALVAGEH